MLRPTKDVLLALCVAISMAGCDRTSAEGRPAPSTSASAAPSVAVTRAVIMVDAAHDVMLKKDAPAYAIAPAAALVIQLGEHHFTARGDAGPSEPDAIHVARGSEGYYRASFKGKQAVLDAVSLDVVKGREAFPGFLAGESYIVAIGTEAAGVDGAMRFAPAWTAKVTVAAK